VVAPGRSWQKCRWFASSERPPLIVNCILDEFAGQLGIEKLKLIFPDWLKTSIPKPSATNACGTLQISREYQALPRPVI
jgi:hypothetical protein